MSLAERLWANVDKNGPTPAHAPELGSCWVWLRGRSNGTRRWEQRYGLLSDGKKRHATHRLAWMLTHGEVPARLCVMHKCDNPPCCNPAHLEVGPQVRNRRDASVRGRTFGKLTALDAIEIHVLSARGESQRSIANKFGVARSTVVCVLAGVTFVHVHDAIAKWCARTAARRAA